MSDVLPIQTNMKDFTWEIMIKTSSMDGIYAEVKLLHSNCAD